MKFMVEHKRGPTFPTENESQESVNDRASGADIFCIHKIENNMVTMAFCHPKPDDAILNPTLSLTLEETKTLFVMLGEFLSYSTNNPFTVRIGQHIVGHHFKMSVAQKANIINWFNTEFCAILDDS